jgi:hypothetical protein
MPTPFRTAAKSICSFYVHILWLSRNLGLTELKARTGANEFSAAAVKPVRASPITNAGPDLASGISRA